MNRKLYPALIGGVILILLFPPATSDYGVYRAAWHGATGDYGNFYYYPYPFLLLLTPAAILPYALGYQLWAIVNLCAYAYACHRKPAALYTFYVFAFTTLGQPLGLMAMGLAMMLRYRHTNALLTGLGLALILSKPHYGLPLAAIILLDTRRRHVVLMPYAVMIVLSFVVWGNWLALLMDNIAAAPDAMYNPVWQAVGVLGVVLWLPLAMVRGVENRLRFATVCLLLTLPYSRPYDMALLWWQVGALGVVDWLQAGLGYEFYLVVCAILYVREIGVIMRFKRLIQWVLRKSYKPRQFVVIASVEPNTITAGDSVVMWHEVGK